MYKKSLIIIEIISYLRAFWLGSMISILFLKFIWLNDVDIWIFHFLMWIFIFLLEIPTWSFADKYSYKLSINLSFLFLSLAFLSFVLSIFLGKFTIFILTALFFSLSSSFASWAQNSYIFSIFKHENKLDKYLYFKTKISKYSRIIQWIAIFLWTYLYEIREYLPYLIQFVLIFFAFILSLYLKKEPIENIEIVKRWDILKTIKYFFSHKIIVGFLVLLTLSSFPFEYFHHVINQSIFVEIGISVKNIWIIGACSYLLSSFLIHFAPNIWNKFWEFKSYLFLIVLSILVWISYGLSDNIFFIIFITSIAYFIMETKGIFLDNSLQFRIKDWQRATLLSIFSMMSNLPTKLLFIACGMIFIWFSYVEVLGILSLVFWFLSVFYIVVFLGKYLRGE